MFCRLPDECDRNAVYLSIYTHQLSKLEKLVSSDCPTAHATRDSASLKPKMVWDRNKETENWSGTVKRRSFCCCCLKDDSFGIISKGNQV